MLKRIFIAGAIAVAAFAASADQREAFAEMAYTGGGGCAVLGSPSNDFFCNEYYLDNSGNLYSGTSADATVAGSEKLCGPYSKSRCGGETTKVVEVTTCTEWMVTDLSANLTIWTTSKPAGGSANIKIECSQRITTTTTTVLANRWNM
jgi:hypothetical protein